MNQSFGNIIEPDKKTLTYEKYLKTAELLDLQQMLSAPREHDELLFIVIHQVYELWFKQIIHETALAASCLEQNHLMRFLHTLKRICAIQKVLIQQIDVLETMPPDDFHRFRNHLNPASGFQSFQFRYLEFKLGMKNVGYLRFFEHDPKLKALLTQALSEPTLYDQFLRLMKKKGYNIPTEVINRDVNRSYELNPQVTAVFRQIYAKPYENSEIYLSLESMLDVDENFLLWRQRHVNMVERIIGGMIGTGGSTGADYLRSTLTKRCFPEIWDVRNLIGGQEQYGR
ncbi:MAG: tryptophan 2,3-dioxygenase [Oligoflexales bacterium]